MSKRVCKRCGVEMTPRENREGDGYCFVCAAVHGPEGVRRSMNEAIREMASSEDLE